MNEDIKLGIDLDEISLYLPGKRSSIDRAPNLIFLQHELPLQLANNSDELERSNLAKTRVSIFDPNALSWSGIYKLFADRVNWRTTNIKTKISFEPIVSILIIKDLSENNRTCRCKQLTFAFVTIERQKYRFRDRF